MSKGLRLSVANKAQLLFTLAVVVILAAVLVVVWARMQALAEVSPRQRASDFVSTWLDRRTERMEQVRLAKATEAKPAPTPTSSTGEGGPDADPGEGPASERARQINQAIPAAKTSEDTRSTSGKNRAASGKPIQPQATQPTQAPATSESETETKPEAKPETEGTGQSSNGDNSSSTAAEEASSSVEAGVQPDNANDETDDDNSQTAEADSSKNTGPSDSPPQAKPAATTTYELPGSLRPEAEFRFTLIPADQFDQAVEERPFLARAIRQFRFRPDVNERFGSVTDSADQTYYRYVRPIRQSQWAQAEAITKQDQTTSPPQNHAGPKANDRADDQDRRPVDQTRTDQGEAASIPDASSPDPLAGPEAPGDVESMEETRDSQDTGDARVTRDTGDVKDGQGQSAEQSAIPPDNNASSQQTPASENQGDGSADQTAPAGPASQSGSDQADNKAAGSSADSAKGNSSNDASTPKANAPPASSPPNGSEETHTTDTPEPTPSERTDPAQPTDATNLAEADPIKMLALVQLRDTQVQTRETMNLIYLAAAGLLGSVLALGMFWLVTSGVFLSPLRLLRSQARLVQAGQSQVRTELGTGDEYEELAQMLNTLVNRWQESRDELAQVNKSMNLKLDKLAESNVALYEANKVKTEFLANVSHELRTPLHSIVGFAEVLQEQSAQANANHDEKRERYLNNIITSSKRLLELITDLLDLAKIEAGRMELNVGRVSIRDTCEGLITLIGPLAEPREITLRQKIESNLPMVETDAGKLQQILFNFMSNAVKFSPDGGAITLSATEVSAQGTNHPSRIRISVTDRGPGISAEDRERIFDKFTQLDSTVTRAQGGTGLGLTICSELAQLLQGRIEVASDTGKGATFTLVIPSIITPAAAPLMPEVAQDQRQILNDPVSTA